MPNPQSLGDLTDIAVVVTRAVTARSWMRFHDALAGDGDHDAVGMESEDCYALRQLRSMQAPALTFFPLITRSVG